MRSRAGDRGKNILDRLRDGQYDNSEEGARISWMRQAEKGC